MTYPITSTPRKLPSGCKCERSEWEDWMKDNPTLEVPRICSYHSGPRNEWCGLCFHDFDCHTKPSAAERLEDEIINVVYPPGEPQIFNRMTRRQAAERLVPFIRRDFVRLPNLLPSGMTVGDLRDVLKCSHEASLEYKIVAHLLSILDLGPEARV